MDQCYSLPMLNQVIFICAALACLTPFLSAGLALLLGVAVAIFFGNPFAVQTRKLTHQLLSLAVIGLGAGMNLMVVAKVGFQGIGYTIIGIAAAFIFGTLLGKMLGTEKDTSFLITVGTAICGGSAIAAVAPVLKAKNHEVSVALGIVFLLNACALFIFPFVGHSLHLTEGQFGVWSALAIHDTSSVVGATLQYGAHALEVGTTVKLARALWIVPITFATGMMVARQGKQGAGTEKPKRPWFILGFLMMAALMTWVPDLKPAGHIVEAVAKRMLILTLFLIGTNLTKETLKAVGFKPFIQGICLWILMASGTLLAIMNGLIVEN